MKSSIAGRNMNIVLIIQARMGSARLPGKVLLPLGNTVVLDYVVQRCKAITGLIDVVVATSALSSDDPIVEWCENNGITCFRGSENDVLSRYYECAKSYMPDYFIRVTSDCPFVDFDQANDLIRLMNDQPCDIVTYNEDELPRGLCVELISFSALETCYFQGLDLRHREHVTYYIYEFLDQFKSVHYDIPEELKKSQLRLTLDTVEDYRLCTAVANHFSDNICISSTEVVSYLMAHPEIAALNAQIEQKPVV